MQHGIDGEKARALGIDPARLGALADYLDRRYLTPGLLPHAQLLVSRDEQVVLRYTAGRARETGEPLREDSLFRIASMTKPVTAVAFMMLVEAGRVALDDPVATVLPEFADLRVGMRRATPARPMQMIDLLRHTSGLTYGLQRQSAIDAEYRRLGLDEFHQKRSADEFIAALAALPLEFSPGDQWNYSVSTDVLGIVVERLSGMPLDRFFADRIFAPLGMADTFFQVPLDKIDRLTDAWLLQEDGQGITPYDRATRSAWSRPMRFCTGGGGLVSSTSDYHRFARMLLRGGELDGARLLKPGTVAAMCRNHLPGRQDLATLSASMFSEASNAGTGFGLGFAVTVDPAAGLGTGHAGEYFWGGIFSTYFFVDPVERLICIFMTQHFPSSVYPIRAQLRLRLHKALLTG